MTKKQREKAALIAKDALKWIKKPSVTVKTSNAYCAIFDYSLDEREYASTGKYAGMQLQDVAAKLITKKNPCEICALGALFLGKVDLFNKFKVPEHFGMERGPITEQLKTVFSPLQMNMIEACFENPVSELKISTGESYYDYDYYHNPFCDIEDSTECLRAILKAIIKGNGELILEKVAAA